MHLQLSQDHYDHFYVTWLHHSQFLATAGGTASLN